MRIAVIGHVRHAIAPPFMGGMEAHSWQLVDALVRRGHDVTLFASGDSDVALPRGAALFPTLRVHYDAEFPWHRFHGTDALNAHVDAGFARAAGALLEGDFDVVHNNSLHRYPPRLARVHRLPTVTSLHVPPFDALRRAVHESAAPWSLFTVTSRKQLTSWWPDGAGPEAHVAYNGIDCAQWPFRPGGDGSAVWAGRITPTKGTHLAAQAARIAGMPLSIFGSIENQDYFDAEVRPHLSAAIRYEGHVSGRALADAYASASVLMFTPCWDEPFGLAAIEAMATGLPVAAIEMGAVREVVGEAGTYAAPDDAEGLARAALAALDIPPEIPARRVRDRFTLDRMVDTYEALYAAASKGLDGPTAPPVRFPPIELAVSPAH